MKGLDRRYKSDTYIKYAKYEDQWIALTFDESRLLGHSNNLVKLHKEVTKEKKYKDARYIHVPPSDTYLAFSIS